MIKPITFPGQKVPAVAHGAIFQRLLRDGKLYGCGISKSGSTLNIGAGLFVEAGRLIEILTTETVSVAGTSGYARIKGVIDTSKGSSADSFQQFAWVVDYASTPDGFDALTQGKVNEGGAATYEMELCVVAVNASGISEITRGFADADTKRTGRIKLTAGVDYGAQLPTDIKDGELFFMV